MRTHEKSFTAGQSETLTINGNFFVLLSSDAPVDLEFEYVGQSGATDICLGIEEGYSEQFPAQLTAVKVTSATAQVIKYGYGTGIVKFDRVVSQTTVHQSTAIQDHNPVVVGTSAGLVLAGGSRSRIIFTADSANVGLITLGGEDVTTANGAIILAAGDSWVETIAADAAFYAVASIAAQGLRISGA